MKLSIFFLAAVAVCLLHLLPMSHCYTNTGGYGQSPEQFLSQCLSSCDNQGQQVPGQIFQFQCKQQCQKQYQQMKQQQQQGPSNTGSRSPLFQCMTGCYNQGYGQQSLPQIQQCEQQCLQQYQQPGGPNNLPNQSFDISNLPYPICMGFCAISGRSACEQICNRG